MDKINKYSTTHLLVKDKPTLEQNPEYRLTPQLFLPIHPKRMHEGGLRKKGLFKKSYEDKPLISIVTVVYNGEKYLEQTIKSVLEQDYDNIEYIIIDGGSTDGTLDIIKKFEDAIDYGVSEPDSGIYDAMNKGTSLCSGDYVAFLNADDWYNLDTLSHIVSSIKINPNLDFLFGSVNMYSEKSTNYIFRPELSKYQYQMPLPHPALFVKLKFLLKEGFDLKYKVIADYDFVTKLIKQKLRYKELNVITTNFRIEGISSTQSYEKEHFQLAYSHFSLPIAIKKYIIRNNKYYLSLPKTIIKKLIFFNFWKKND